MNRHNPFQRGVYCLQTDSVVMMSLWRPQYVSDKLSHMTVWPHLQSAVTVHTCFLHPNPPFIPVTVLWLFSLDTTDCTDVKNEAHFHRIVWMAFISVVCSRTVTDVVVDCQTVLKSKRLMDTVSSKVKKWFKTLLDHQHFIFRTWGSVYVSVWTL